MKICEHVSASEEIPERIGYCPCWLSLFAVTVGVAVVPLSI